MKKIIALAAGLMVATAPAHANVVLFDDFDGESAASVLNFAAFDNFDVQDGTVDYLKNFAGLSCVSGGCVDLDGSTGNAGIIVTKLGYAFNAGDVVTLSFDLSGNQRGRAGDTILFGFRSTAGAINYDDVMLSLGGPAVPFGDFFLADLDGSAGPILSTSSFATYSLSFTAGNAGSIKAYVGNDGVDNIGPILDNFKLDITAPAVPEPASWALMIGGFAAAGAALRRRSGAVRFA